MNPIVSIIVPVYGVERYIERCAVSLFEQTYTDIEYIFVNDATPDKSIDVLRAVIDRYPERAKTIRIVEHPHNKGLSAARNTGIDNATGEYVWHVDSDDYVATDAVEKWVETAEKHRADIVICDINVVTTNGIFTEQVQYSYKEDYIRRLLQHTQKCAHWNKFYRRSLLERTGIRSDEQIRLAEDFAVTPRLVHQAQSISVLHEPLYYYETTNQSSYVHNLTRASIESQYRADQILIGYFTTIPDAAVYADIVSVLPQRSMVSLIKNAGISSWPEIIEVYKDHLSQDPSKGMTLVNRIIFSLAKNRSWGSLQLFMRLYHFVIRFHP